MQAKHLQSRGVALLVMTPTDRNVTNVEITVRKGTKARNTGAIIEARGQENGHNAVCFAQSEKTDTQATRPNGMRTAT